MKSMNFNPGWGPMDLHRFFMDFPSMRIDFPWIPIDENRFSSMGIHGSSTREVTKQPYEKLLFFEESFYHSIVLSHLVFLRTTGCICVCCPRSPAILESGNWPLLHYLIQYFIFTVEIFLLTGKLSFWELQLIRVHSTGKHFIPTISIQTAIML